MSDSKKRPRRERRADARELDKLLRKNEQLAKLAPGGTSEHPIEVESASQVELRAKALGCARCGSESVLQAHEARVIGGVPLREVTTRCKTCGARRVVWLRLRGALLS